MGFLEDIVAIAGVRKKQEVQAVEDVFHILLLTIFSASVSKGLSSNPSLTSQEIADKSIATAIAMVKNIKEVKSDEL